MQLTKTSAEQRLGQMLMSDMPVMEIASVVTAVAPDWFAKWKSLRREFMKSLSDSIQELSFLNLSQNEFMGLIMGRELPENLTIRWRIPLQFGGKLDIDNMFLCKLFPYSHNLDKFIIDQADAKTLWLPDPAKKVYVPVNMLGGTDGGNATTDRLTQSIGQFAQISHGME